MGLSHTAFLFPSLSKAAEVQIERGDYPGIHMIAVQEACGALAAGLEELLWRHASVTGKRGVVVSATDDAGIQCYWIEPRIPDVTYQAMTWQLNEKTLEVHIIDLDSNFVLPR